MVLWLLLFLVVSLFLYLIEFDLSQLNACVIFNFYKS